MKERIRQVGDDVKADLNRNVWKCVRTKCRNVACGGTKAIFKILKIVDDVYGTIVRQRDDKATTSMTDVLDERAHGRQTPIGLCSDRTARIRIAAIAGGASKKIEKQVMSLAGDELASMGNNRMATLPQVRVTDDDILRSAALAGVCEALNVDKDIDSVDKLTLDKCKSTASMVAHQLLNIMSSIDAECLPLQHNECH